MAMLLAALLLVAPPVDEAPPAPEGPEGQLDAASEADAAAWESVGWGEAEDTAPAQPEPESDDSPPGPADAPGDPAASASASDEASWGAAGWGNESSTDPASSPAPVEGPSAPPEEAVEDWSAWDSESKSNEDPEPTRKLKVGDVLAGSLRLTGSFLHYTYEPVDFILPTPDPNDDPLASEITALGIDDALALTVARALVEADVGKHLHFSFNGFGELARVPEGAGAGGNFASAGSTTSAYRTRFLAYQFWSPGANGPTQPLDSVSGQVGVEWASMRLHFDPVNIDIGRFPITYTVAGGLSTNDFFAPFSATAVNTLYKPGVDAVRVSTGIGKVSSVDLVGVLGYATPCNAQLGPLDPCEDPDYRPDVPTWGRSAVLARAATVGAGFEWAALGGKVSERWVAGGSIQGGIGPVNLRAEFHVGIPDAEGDGHDGDDLPVYGRVSGGPFMSFAWQNAVISAEYLYASDGERDSVDYLTRAAYSDDLPYLGQHYVSAAYAMEIIPILRFSVSGLVSATDGSGLAGVSFVYNVANESDLILGLFIPWGRRVQNGNWLTGPIDIGSEFGLAPLSAYLEARVFF